MNSDAAGHDSFLDVATNMVGILIILVMVVGMRIKNAPMRLPANPQVLHAKALVEKDQATERALHQEVMQTAAQIEALAEQTAIRRQQRDLLAMMVSAAEHKLRSEREKLDAEAQAEFEASRQLLYARRSLDRLRQTQRDIQQALARTEIIQNYPTPLAKTVVGQEAHFQLRSGRVAPIPLERLLLLARSDAQAKADRLLGQRPVPEFSETVGPEQGFRLRYTATREDRTEQTPNGLARVAYLKIVRWTVVAVSGQLGEPVEKALAPGSEFRQALSTLPPGETTVTIWVYPDSFEAFRRLREELYRLGFLTAARPLPEGVMIGGSPKGTRSEAE
ncbi:MAG: hypothetical protein ACUVUC_14425 [Thermoguttaceae bacterium]